MSQKILVLCGSKQTGKTTIGNFVTGTLLEQHKLIDRFGLNEKGDLVVPAEWKDEHGNSKVGEGILNLYSRDPGHFQYFSQNVWPIVKCYALADRLKMIIHLAFGVSLDLLNGTDEQKNYPSKIQWNQLFRFLAPQEIKKIKSHKRENNFMSYRDLMQRFGTDVFRSIDKNCWIDRTVNDIKNEKPGLAIVTDCRFSNEVLYFKNNKNKNTKIVYLKPIEGNASKRDKHQSETELSTISEKNFDLIIDDPKRTMAETLQNHLMPKLVEWGFVEEPKEEEKKKPVLVENTETIYK